MMVRMAVAKVPGVSVKWSQTYLMQEVRSGASDEDGGMGDAVMME